MVNQPSMAGMLVRLLLPALIAAAGLALFAAAACGGGGDAPAKSGVVTDPEKVPSATPVTGTPAAVYQITNDRVVIITASTPSANGTAAGNVRTYKVKAGDTCGTIASELKTTVEALIRANRTINEDCSNLKIDDLLRLPVTATPTAGATTGRVTSTPKPGTAREYTVRAGDTCSDIAANQKVDVTALIQLNNLDANCTNLKIGQVLKVP